MNEAKIGVAEVKGVYARVSVHMQFYACMFTFLCMYSRMHILTCLIAVTSAGSSKFSSGFDPKS